MGSTISEPTGTWKKSAESYDFNPSTSLLVAKLKTKDGSIKESSTIATFGMSLDNDNGEFKIKSKGQYNHLATKEIYSKVLPAGNWFLSAKDIVLSDGILSAQLLKPDGNYSHSTIVVLDGCVVENNCGNFQISFSNYNINKNNNDNNTDNSQNNSQTIKYPPLGSWISSAENILLTNNRFNDNILTATLTSCDGTKHRQTIKYKLFDVYENDNGNFKYVGNHRNKFVD